MFDCFLFFLAYAMRVVNQSHHILLTHFPLFLCPPFFKSLLYYIFVRFFPLFIAIAVVVDDDVVDVDRRSPEEEDDLSEVRADAVPPEVRAWLASTFTRQISTLRKPGEPDKPKFRSVANAIRAGIFVERIYRRMSSSSFLQFPPEVARNLKVRTYFDEFTIQLHIIKTI
jgi:calcium/calmodulin-dependent 3',5'-cyclic nucleotide phosphodiesterase